MIAVKIQPLEILLDPVKGVAVDEMDLVVIQGQPGQL
jgi:hypothetical protein